MPGVKVFLSFFFVLFFLLFIKVCFYRVCVLADGGNWKGDATKEAAGGTSDTSIFDQAVSSNSYQNLFKADFDTAKADYDNLEAPMGTTTVTVYTILMGGW